MKATLIAFTVVVALVAVYTATEHLLAFVALVVAAVVLAWVGLSPDRDELAPIPDPYRSRR